MSAFSNSAIGLDATPCWFLSIENAGDLTLELRELSLSGIEV
jgi:hypothetical protein